MELIEYIENLIGEKVNNPNLYPVVFEHHSDVNLEDERLEYLGDAVLDSIVADYLFNEYKDKHEGFLTVMRSNIVNRKSLNDIAIKLEIDKYVKIKKEDNIIKHVYGNILESLIGALYLDFEYKKTMDIVLNRIILPNFDTKDIKNNTENYKGALLEYAQKSKQKIEFLTYQIDDKEKVLFESRIVINNILQRDIETSTSKKESEQNLAKKILQRI